MLVGQAGHAGRREHGIQRDAGGGGRRRGAAEGRIGRAVEQLARCGIVIVCERRGRHQGEDAVGNVQHLRIQRLEQGRHGAALVLRRDRRRPDGLPVLSA